MVFFGELVIWRRPRQTNLKALVNLGSCHSHRKSALAQSIWSCPAPDVPVKAHFRQI